MCAVIDADKEHVNDDGYEEVRETRTGKLLFELNPERLLVRVVERKRIRAIVNLRDYGLAFVGDETEGDRGFV